MKECAKKNIFYYYLLFLTIIMPIIPKDVNLLFKYIPIRLLLPSILIIIYLYELIIKKKKMLKPPKFFIIIYGLMLVLMAFGFIRAIDKVLFLYTYMKFLILGIFTYVLITYDLNKKQVDTIYNSLFFSSVIVSLNGLLNYVLYQNLNLNGIFKYSGSRGRVISTFFNPIYLGIYLLIIIGLLMYKIIGEKNKKKLVIYYFVLVLNIIVLLLTFTRTVAVLLLITILFLLFIELIFKSNFKTVLIKGIIILFFLIFSIYTIPGVKYLYSSTIVNFLPASMSYKILDFSNNFLHTNIDLNLYGFVNVKVDNEKKENNNKVIDDSKNKNEEKVIIEEKKEITNDDYNDASVLSRKEFKSIAKKVIKDNGKIGVGLGNYETYVLKNKDKYVNKKFGYPHNSFLHLMAESGKLTGFLLGILIIGIIIYSCTKMIFLKSLPMTILFITWINVFIIAMYESLFYDTQLCPLLLLASVLLVKSFNFSKEKNVMYISSVGGHLTQLLQLKSLFNKSNYILITEKTDVTKDLKEKYNVNYLKYCSGKNKISYLCVFIFNSLKSIFLYMKYNPDVVVTTGANTCFVMCILAKLFGKKVIYIESFAKRTSPTTTGKYIYKLHAYTIFVVQWESLLKVYPKAQYWGWIY